MPQSYFKTNLLSNVDLYNGSSFTVEYENKFKFNIPYYTKSLNTQIGIYYPINSINPVFGDVKGFYVKEELKFYKDVEKYYSIAFIYSKSNYFQTLMTPTNSIDYETKRQYLGLDLTIGTLKRLSNNFIYELYFGIGTRINKIDVFLSPADLMFREYGDWTVPHNWIQKSGLHLIPKINLGLKFGFIYGKAYIRP